MFKTEGEQFALKGMAYGNMKAKDMTNEQLEEYLEMRKSLSSFKNGLSDVLDAIREKVKEEVK